MLHAAQHARSTPCHCDHAQHELPTARCKRNRPQHTGTIVPRSKGLVRPPPALGPVVHARELHPSKSSSVRQQERRPPLALGGVGGCRCPQRRHMCAPGQPTPPSPSPPPRRHSSDDSADGRPERLAFLARLGELHVARRLRDHAPLPRALKPAQDKAEGLSAGSEATCREVE